MKQIKLTKLISWMTIVVFAVILGGYAVAQTYYVQPGDSLYQIASRYGTSVNALQTLNQLGGATLYPGQALQIGASKINQSNYHTVSAGESLFLIAQRYQVSVAALQKSNNLSGTSLAVGQRLIIPAAVTGTATMDYTVKVGDTLYLIAKQHQISLDALLNLNRLNTTALLVPGQTLKLPSSAKAVTSPGTSTLSQSDLDLLARLVSAESAGEPFVGQVAVAATILNRLQDKRYPKTISGIVYQINFGCYQYSPVLDGRINQPATASAYRAVRRALSGWDPSNGATGFYNPAKTTSSWVRSHPTTAVIGGHVFFNY